MAYLKDRNDFGILRQDGSTKVGLILARDKNDTPYYVVNDDEFLASQQFTTPGYGALPPEKEIALRQDDWISGFGQYVYDADDTKRYHKSIGMDMRHKGMGILSWEATGVSLPTVTPTIANADMELAASWLGDGAQSTDQARSPTHSWKLQNAAAVTDESYQDLSGYVPNGVYTFTCYYYLTSSANEHVHIAIDDGVDITESAAGTTTGSWTQLSVTKTIAFNATRLRVKLIWTAAAINQDAGYFDDAALTTTMTMGAPTCFAEFNGVRYLGCGSFLCKLNAAGTTLSMVAYLAGLITDLSVFTDGFLYIGQKSDQVIENCEDAWTSGTHATASLDTGDYKVGSGSCKIVGSSVVNGDVIAYEAISSLDLSKFTGVKLWIKSSAAVAANDLCLILSDAADCSTSDDIISLPALTAGVWTRIFVRQVDPSANTAILAVGLEYNANAADTTIHIDDIKAESSYYYMGSGESLTQSTLAVATTDSFAELFQAVGLTMWKHLPPNNVYSATDPSNAGVANWSTATTVDTTNYDILALLSNGTSLVIKKEDRTFYIDSAGAVQILVGETKHLAGDTTCRCSTYWQGKYYIGCGTQSLLEYDGGTITWRSPAKFCTNLHEFTGKINAVTGDEEYLFAIIDNDTDSTVEILCGRLETINGSTSWVWHPYQQITLTSCGNAWVSSISPKSLWIASTVSTESLYRLPLPTGYGNITGDSNKDSLSGGYFITPFLHGNFKGDDKAFIKLILTMEATTSALYFTVEYQLLGSSNWTEINPTAKFKTSPITAGYIPVDDVSGVNPIEVMIRFKITGITNSTSTPILKEYDCRAILYPTKRRIIQAIVRGADDITDKQGMKLDVNAALIKTVIEEAADATWPVTIYDPEGSTKYVRFLASKPFSKIVRDEKSRNIERWYYLTMQEVSLS